MMKNTFLIRWLAFVLLLAAIVLCGTSPAAAQAAPRLPEGFTAHLDLVYARVDGKPLRLDVYSPTENREKSPLIVWVHGGAWRGGDKRRCPALPFLSKGFVVASINYRLSQQALFPAQIEDCKAAIRWLRRRADRYSIDPRRIGVWGSSAGGHLVALLGSAGDVKKWDATHGDQDVSSRVQAVCDFFGPTDFLQMDAHAPAGSRIVHDAPNSPESRLVGGPIQQNKEKVAAANPITYVTADDPPFLIVHGDKDTLVPHHQSELLAEALQKAKVKVEFHTVRGAGHGFGGRKEVDQWMEEFFRKHLSVK